jgi:hypothetical protein
MKDLIYKLEDMKGNDDTISDAIAEIEELRSENEKLRDDLREAEYKLAHP